MDTLPATKGSQYTFEPLVNPAVEWEQATRLVNHPVTIRTTAPSPFDLSQWQGDALTQTNKQKSAVVNLLIKYRKLVMYNEAQNE